MLGTGRWVHFPAIVALINNWLFGPDIHIHAIRLSMVQFEETYFGKSIAVYASGKSSWLNYNLNSISYLWVLYNGLTEFKFWNSLIALVIAHEWNNFRFCLICLLLLIHFLNLFYKFSCYLIDYLNTFSWEFLLKFSINVILLSSKFPWLQYGQQFQFGT